MGYFSNVRLHIRLPSFLASLLTREIERHHGNISTWRLVTIRPPCSKHLFEDYQLFIHISFQPNSWYTRYWPFKLPEGGNKNVPKPCKIWKKEVLTFIMNQMISNGICINGILWSFAINWQLISLALFRLSQWTRYNFCIYNICKETFGNFCQRNTH